MNMHVIDDAGAGGAPEVDADVYPVRLVHLGERNLRESGELHHFRLKGDNIPAQGNALGLRSRNRHSP